MKKKHIIIGTSAAGIGAAQKLRHVDQESDIVCISDEPDFPYNKCFFADYLAGRKQQQELYTRKSDFFEKNRIQLLLNARVTNIEPEKKQLVLHDNSRVSYYTLFLGLGRKLPSFVQESQNLNGFFTFNSLISLLNLEKYILEQNVRSVVIIGAGLTGVECADALARFHVDIHIIDASAHMLSSLCTSAGADFIAAAMQQARVTLHQKKMMRTLISDHGRVRGVILNDGTEIEAHMVISAVSGPINSDLAVDAGIMCDERTKSIITNEYLQTSAESIYAGGDVILIYDQLLQKRVPSCLWADAMLQGAIAAQNMAGLKKAYPGTVVVASSSFFGLNFASCGPITQESMAFEHWIQRTEELFAHYLIAENKLKGFLLIGKQFNLSLLRRLVLTQEPITQLSF
jgi:nitrite reductase (NADH) large subunit